MQKRSNIDKNSLKILQETREALSRTESLPYSENLRSVMDTNLLTCSPTDPAKKIIKEMAARGTSSIIAVEDNSPVGILTEKDILRRIIVNDCAMLGAVTISEIMTPSPITQSPDDTIYRAMATLSAEGIKHLPLVEAGRLVGIVTMRQLLKLRYPEPMTLVEGIRSAENTAALKKLKDALPALAGAKLSMGIQAVDVVVMLSLINQDLHTRAFELAIEQHGEPPAPVCLYVTGSHGRLENLLTPDQDHGLIIDDRENPGISYNRYFVDLTTTFSEMLAEIGFITCPGYIMCQNPLWRKGLSEWKEQIHYWFSKQVRELGRFMTVVFDARPIFGDPELFAIVRDSAFSELSVHHEALRVLHEEEGHHKPPTGIFGRFLTERKGPHRGQLDIKRSGLIFMVEGARIMALRHNCRETSTLKRIRELTDAGHFHKDDGDYFSYAYQLLLHLALDAQVEKAAAGKKINNFISPDLLSKRDRETLRHAFKAVAVLQDIISSEFGELVI